MILDTLALSSKERVEKAKSALSLEELKNKIYHNGKVMPFHNRENFAFEKALQQPNISFICEIKKASPSKGLIAKDFPYLEIAKDYEAAGASAISVLTEPFYFKGDDSYLTQVSGTVTIPVLRKDFTVDEYQIYEAKYLGADAVLLICALLTNNELIRYIKICNELGLSALVESHTKKEVISAMNAGARVIGVNNRNLQTFHVNLDNCLELREMVPSNITYIAESGISTPEHISRLKKARVDAVLIGERLMTSKDKKETLSYLQGSCHE